MTRKLSARFARASTFLALRRAFKEYLIIHAECTINSCNCGFKLLVMHPSKWKILCGLLFRRLIVTSPSISKINFMFLSSFTKQ